MNRAKIKTKSKTKIKEQRYKVRTGNMQKTKSNGYDKLLNYMLSMEKGKKSYVKVRRRTQLKAVLKKRVVSK